MNFVFFGTPQIAADTLEILKKNGYLPSLIVTAPDKPVGRKQIITPPPVKVWAEKNKIPILQPEKLDSDFKLEIGNCLPCVALAKWGKLEIFIVVAYGKIFPEWLINLPGHGTLNIHYSLLPKYRGAAPVQSAILNGETETGVTIQKMVYKLDAGPIVAQEKIAIGKDEKTPELMERLTKIGSDLLVKILPDYIEGKIKLQEQNHVEATFCKKIVKEDGLIDLNNDGAKNYNKFRAYTSWPRTFFFHNNKRIIITNAVLEDDPFDKVQSKKFTIKKVLPEGKKETLFTNYFQN